MSADSPDNEYRAVWNQEKQQYEHTQVSNLGEHLFDVIHYEGGEKDGTIDVSFNPDLQFAEEQQVSGNNGESFTIPPQRFTPERGGILGTRTAPGEWKLEHRGANGAATPGFFAELLPLPKVGLAGKLLGALGVKFGSKAVKEGGYLVYQGLDKSGAVKYVGITSRGLAVRAAEHKAAGGAKAGLEFIAIGGMQNLSKTQARVFEQQLINQFGLKKNGGLLLNKINSIAPKNWSQHGIKP